MLPVCHTSNGACVKVQLPLCLARVNTAQSVHGHSAMGHVVVHLEQAVSAAGHLWTNGKYVCNGSM